MYIFLKILLLAFDIRTYLHLHVLKHVNYLSLFFFSFFLCLFLSFFLSFSLSLSLSGVVGWCEGAVYLTSPGRPTDIGLRLGKACYILVVGKGRGGMFLFLLFLHFHSCSSFFPVPSFISSTLSSISFLPFSGRRHKMTLKGWRVVKPQHNQSISLSLSLSLSLLIL